jgi:hypothetical protein
MPQFEMRQWALKGAEQRLLEISEEAAAIHAAFPELRKAEEGASRATLQRRGRPRKAQTAGEPPRAPRKRTMSADARRRISEAQKARWAKQRAQGAVGSASNSGQNPVTRAKSSRKKK